MKTVRSSINKNIKMIIVIAAVTAVALGGLLLLITGNGERNQIPTEPVGDVEDTSEETTAGETEPATTQAAETQQQASQLAQSLYNAKVDSIENSAGVAQLLETIDLKKNVAGYKVELQAKKSPKSMTVILDKTVAEKNKDAFDKKMQMYAEQILALVSDLEEVQWTYTLKREGKPKEDVTVFLNIQQAEELLASNVKSYGQSVQAMDKLLELQGGA